MKIWLVLLLGTNLLWMISYRGHGKVEYQRGAAAGYLKAVQDDEALHHEDLKLCESIP
jgi:hypothetical protein